MEDDTTTALLDDEECGAPQTKTKTSSSDPPSTTSCNLLGKIDSVLSGSFLRGNNVNLLPFLPDPTKSRREREQYTKYVVPFAVASALSPGGPLYGFNVWLLPICLEIYGPDAQYTMKNGLVLYAFTAQVISAAIICLLFSKKLVNWSSGQLMLISTFCFNLALVLCGVCVWYQSDWGLFLVMFFVTGPSRAILALSTLLKAVGWYREIHRPALGAGIFGLILGVWATLFSIWGAALANISVRDSFFWVALITAIMMVPSIFLLRSPEELPLDVDDDSATDGDNTKDIVVQSKKAGFKENTDCPELTAAELSRTRQIWIQDVGWILVMMPGFAIKYTISPVMSALFEASILVQSISSFVFLITYALARFVTGFAIGRIIKLKHGVWLATFISPLMFFFTGTIIRLNCTSTGWMIGFIIANAVVAFCLGAKKIFLTPLALAMWGKQNLPKVSSRSLSALDIASFIGPIIMWQGLSASGDIYIDPKLNTSEEQRRELLTYSSNSLFILGGIAFSAFLCFAFLIKPYRRDPSA